MRDSVALRVQRLTLQEQVLVLAELASRGLNRRFAPIDVEDRFLSLALPMPARMSNMLATLEQQGLVSRGRGRGAVWAVTPEGRSRILSALSESDLHALVAEAAALGGSDLGHTVHPVVPVSLAPAGIVGPVLQFLEDHPFDTNVFAMTRFPAEPDPDRLDEAIAAARSACADHGLTLLLASDQEIVDDLWANVLAHMWASRYGMAFFEDRQKTGINKNMSIEVGAMLMTGRRCALLKDRTVKKMPTDLVGKIYRSVDLDDPASISKEVHSWVTNGLAIGGGT